MLRFRKGGTERLFAFVLELQSHAVGGLLQLEGDELMRDMDAASDLHSSESQKWEHKFHIVGVSWAWTHGALGR